MKRSSLVDSRLPTLCLGVIPSEKPKPFDWQVHADRRAAARSTWVTLQPSDFVVRFVVEDDVPRIVKRNKQIAMESRHHGDIITLSAGFRNGSVCYNAELTARWFSHAVAAWPDARYFAKTEDDMYVNLALLRWDIVRIDAPMLWAGLFQWYGNGDGSSRVGCWGGAFEDDPVHGPKRTKQVCRMQSTTSHSFHWILLHHEWLQAAFPLYF